METAPGLVHLAFSNSIDSADRAAIEAALTEGGLTIGDVADYGSKSVGVSLPQLVIDFESGAALMLGGIAAKAAVRLMGAALKRGVAVARQRHAAIQVWVSIKFPQHRCVYVLPGDEQDDAALDGLLASFNRSGNDWFFWDETTGEWQAQSERKGRPKE